MYLLAASALESIDASMEESARMLGAGWWRTLRVVTVPLVAPAILAGALIAFVNAIALFGSQAIIGLPGRIFTLPTRIYALFDHAVRARVRAVPDLRRHHRGRPRAPAPYLARRSYVTLSGKGHRPQVVALGRARWERSPSAARSSWWRCWLPT